jgi:uncharacterized protein YhaN
MEKPKVESRRKTRDPVSERRMAELIEKRKELDLLIGEATREYFQIRRELEESNVSKTRTIELERQLKQNSDRRAVLRERQYDLVDEMLKLQGKPPIVRRFTS